MLDVRPIEEVSKVGAATCYVSRRCTRNAMVSPLPGLLMHAHQLLSWRLQLPQEGARRCAAPCIQCTSSCCSACSL